ncbi:MAG: hypothetical protein J5832_02220, partial [Clostridia bacterium]|nr:hypothetical protein [Clostridia bacterium]
NVSAPMRKSALNHGEGVYVCTIKRVTALSALEVRRHVGLLRFAATATTPEPTHSNPSQRSFWYFFFRAERNST